MKQLTCVTITASDNTLRPAVFIVRPSKLKKKTCTVQLYKSRLIIFILGNVKYESNKWNYALPHDPFNTHFNNTLPSMPVSWKWFLSVTLPILGNVKYESNKLNYVLPHDPFNTHFNNKLPSMSVSWKWFLSVTLPTLGNVKYESNKLNYALTHDPLISILIIHFHLCLFLESGFFPSHFPTVIFI